MDVAVAAAIYLALVAILFLICRAVVLWYWRVNVTVALLQSIDDKLAVLVANTPRLPTIGDMRP